MYWALLEVGLLLVLVAGVVWLIKPRKLPKPPKRGEKSAKEKD